MSYYILLYIIQKLVVISDYSEVSKANEYASKMENTFVNSPSNVNAAHIEQLKKFTIRFPTSRTLNLGIICKDIDRNLAEKYFNEVIKFGIEGEKIKANQMMAAIALSKKDSVRALQYLESALLLNPNKPSSQHNYEWLKLKFKGNPPPPRAGQNNTTNRVGMGDLEKHSGEEEIREKKIEALNLQQALLYIEAMKEKELYFVPRKKQKDNYGSW